MQNISPGCLFGVQSQFTEQKNVPGLNASEVVVYYALKFFNDKHNYAMIHACIYVDILRYSADTMSLHYAICFTLFTQA